MDKAAFRRTLAQSPVEVINSDSACQSLASLAEDVARYLARHLNERAGLVVYLDQAGQDTFKILKEYWRLLSASFIPGSAANTSSEAARIALALGIGSVERNLVGGLVNLTKRAEDHEPDLRSFLFNVTTFARIEDPAFHRLQAVLAQIVCNIISPGPGPAQSAITDKLWDIYLSGRREDDVIIRLLDSDDLRVNTVILILLKNVMSPSPENCDKVIYSPVGLRWLSKILGKAEVWLESGSALGDNRFELACSIFALFMWGDQQAALFQALEDDTEPLTPSQMTFLKIIDSIELNRTPLDPDEEHPSPDPNYFLIPTFHKLAKYTLASLKSGNDDPRLPKIMAGLVLVVQILTTIGLAVQARLDEGHRKNKIGGALKTVKTMKSKSKGVGLIKPLIELLQQLVISFPRQRPFTTAESSAQGLSSSQQGAMTGINSDIISLLGVLTYDDKPMGDWVRANHGVQTILGLTEVDEANPLLREHALFLVRNIMKNNPENQAIVAQMNPVGLVRDDTGEILPLPEDMQRNMVYTGMHSFTVPGGSDEDEDEDQWEDESENSS